MRNTILAAAAALALIVGTAPSFASAGSDSSNIDQQCPNILANADGYSTGLVDYCRSKE
jgi:hypothetical protein